MMDIASIELYDSISLLDINDFSKVDATSSDQQRTSWKSFAWKTFKQSNEWMFLKFSFIFESRKERN